MTHYRKGIIIFSITLWVIASSWIIGDEIPRKEKPLFIPPSEQRNGDAAKGFDYLVNGDFIKSGLPYPIYKLIFGKDPNNYLNRSGRAADVPPGFNLVKHANGTEIVVPTCLQCHAQIIGENLYLGLGNTDLDFSNLPGGKAWMQNAATGIMKGIAPKQLEAMKNITTSMSTIVPLITTEVRGINAADRLAIVLVAHRDPLTLQWKEKPILHIPDEVVPTDVPAWWLLKKKNAMFYNGFGRGDFGKFLMLSNLLTVTDTAEAREVSTHFNDVLAFLKKLEAPKYPKPISVDLALKGEPIYIANCSKCHGTYGDHPSYPNLLIPSSVIQTDSLLFKSNYQNPQFIEWFNESWFAKGDYPAKLFPSDGYVALPLDGVWITGPYLHNGSVPTLEGVINSRIRPAYWYKNFKNPEYDYNNPGWKHTVYATPPKDKKIYNTTKNGYSNKGHYFGDHLNDSDRKALMEYLKTL